ncbi:MAG: type II toxin-antitoxin system ParD family antitoxin [Pyrinomonadaceae bacterium]|nr:type II toxin-antitoxin system ParD family antitoxin [Pyrinomonadaceae bacterium]
MNITLTPELENLIQKKIESGDYNSASEVVRDALKLLKEQDQLKELRREEIRREVMKGVEQMRNGEFTTYNSAEELAESIISEAKREREAK